MTRRVALAGFLHETNTFAPTKAQMADFVQGGGYMPLARGGDVLTRGRDINLGIGGAVQHGEEAGWDMVPILWAGAIPSAHVTRDAFDTLTDQIVTGLRDAGPLDGVFLDLHGAMVADGYDDCEGDMMARAREIMGPDRVIGLELDPHNHLTDTMLENATLIINYKEYPHVDAPDRAPVEQAWQALLANEYSPPAVFRTTLPSGETRWLRATAPVCGISTRTALTIPYSITNPPIPVWRESLLN